MRYQLAYEQPRLSPDGASVVYEQRRILVDLPSDNAATRWAREEVPRLHGLTHGGRHYPAHPFELRQGSAVVWTDRPSSP